MDRRRFMSLAAVAATSSLAGCSNPLGDGDDGPAERDPENAVLDQLYTAVGELNTAALALGVASEDLDSSGDVEFDESGPRERVTRANEALDAAAEADTGEYEAEIEHARSYATTVESMIDTFASLLAGAEELSSLDGEFDPNATDELRQVVEASRDPLSTAVEESDTAESALSDADDAVLEDLDAEVDRVADALDELSGYAAGLDRLSLGYVSVFDGVDGLSAAQKQFEKEAYEDAQSSFAAARGHFEDARATFEEGDGETPDSVAERLARGADRSESLHTLSDGYATLLDGMTSLETGQAHFEDSEYEQAAAAFADAGASFENADATFDADPVPQDEFDDQFGRARCRSGHLVDAADYFESAANDADSGNLVRAREQAERGEQEVEAARNC